MKLLHYTFWFFVSLLNLLSCQSPKEQNTIIAISTFDSVTMNKGKRNGWAISYYQNGDIKREKFYCNDLPYGDDLTYYENGLPKIYNCFNERGNNRRIKIYDSLGNLIKDEGVIICQASYLGETFETPIDSIVIIDILVSTPPNEMVQVFTKVLNIEKKYRELDIKNNNAVYEQRFHKAGNYSLLIAGESKDTITNKIYKDSLIINFTIRR